MINKHYPIGTDVYRSVFHPTFEDELYEKYTPNIEFVAGLKTALKELYSMCDNLNPAMRVAEFNGKSNNKQLALLTKELMLRIHNMGGRMMGSVHQSAFTNSSISLLNEKTIVYCGPTDKEYLVEEILDDNIAQEIYNETRYAIRLSIQPIIMFSKVSSAVTQTEEYYYFIPDSIRDKDGSITDGIKKWRCTKVCNNHNSIKNEFDYFILRRLTEYREFNCRYEQSPISNIAFDEGESIVDTLKHIPMGTIVDFNNMRYIKNSPIDSVGFIIGYKGAIDI